MVATAGGMPLRMSRWTIGIAPHSQSGKMTPLPMAAKTPCALDCGSHFAPAVARAAMDSGVARRGVEDFEAYADKLARFVFRSGFMMKPLFAKARESKKRVIYSEGEDERVLRADPGRARGGPGRAGADRAPGDHRRNGMKPLRLWR